MKTTLKYLLISACLFQASKAETISMFQDTFSIVNTQTSSLLSARWGTWDGTQFTQSILSDINSGYADPSAPELQVSLNQTDNSNFTAGNKFALAIFTDGNTGDRSTLNWSSAKFGTVLIDTNWTIPSFSNNTNAISFILNDSTSAVIGSFVNNGGVQIIGMDAISVTTGSNIPEPSSYAAIFGLSVLGMAHFRRRSGNRILTN
jgi:hypothetical protein